MQKTKQKLFRMTLPRKIILGDIASTVKLKAEHYYKEDESQGHSAGFARLTAEYIEDEQKKKEAIEKCDMLEKKYQHCWEVIWITMCHNENFLINLHCNGGRGRYDKYNDLPWREQCEKMDERDERGWYSEWDIPLDVFNNAIDEVIELLNWYQERTANDYTKQLKLLDELKKFRNTESVA